MGSGGLITSHSYTELFEQLCPYYMALGMTYDQFWRDDFSIVKYFKKMDEISRERENQKLWLQGYYIYQAIGSYAEIIPAFPKKGAKVYPYVEEPLPITKIAQEEREEKKRQERFENIKRKMLAYANKHNRGTTDGQ